MSIPKPSKRILDFEQMGFGMFVHWGLYSQLERAEWIQDFENIPYEEYKKLKNTFTAEDFDAEKLVLMAKNAGCKYITLTTRHHEGFSLYDTCGINDFDAPHSPAKRDLVREFVDACNKHGIVPFFYQATLDWYDEDNFKNDFDAYLENIRRHVEVLCRNYGKIGGFWFDGNWSRPEMDWKETELYQTIRKYQPEAIIINNTGLSARGETGHPEIDSVTFENGKVEPVNREGHPKYVAGEMCHTINTHWGYAKNDFNYKSPSELIESICACRRAGANYLLNIGPEGQGGINPYQTELFKVMGKWMDIFGEAIYNGRPCGAGTDDKAFILKSVDGKYLYIFAYELETCGDRNVIEGGKRQGCHSFNDVRDRIESIEWMDNGEELDFVQKDGMFCVNLTGTPYGTNYCVRVAKAKIAE